MFLPILKTGKLLTVEERNDWLASPVDVGP
ncbi:MAG: hypothetical protein RLZZ422_906 [Pseudomonadota bacterium]|jgi:hypothetical protein